MLYRNKKPISNSEDCSITIEKDFHMYILKLEVNECESSKHDGTYIIQAKNSSGESKCSIQVNVKPDPTYKKKSKQPKEK